MRPVILRTSGRQWLWRTARRATRLPAFPCSRTYCAGNTSHFPPGSGGLSALSVNLAVDVVLVIHPIDGVGGVGTQDLTAVADGTPVARAVVRSFSGEEVIDGVEEAAGEGIDVEAEIGP